MAALNVAKTIKDYKGTGKINTHYDLCVSYFEVIERMSNCYYDLICNAFIFGYAQGTKATKAEMKKKEAVAV